MRAVSENRQIISVSRPSEEVPLCPLAQKDLERAAHAELLVEMIKDGLVVLGPALHQLAQYMRRERMIVAGCPVRRPDRLQKSDYHPAV